MTVAAVPSENDRSQLKNTNSIYTNGPQNS